MKKKSFWSIVENNGLASNIVYTGILSLIGLCASKIWNDTIVSIFLAVSFLVFGRVVYFLWYRRECFWAKECGFKPPSLNRSEIFLPFYNVNDENVRAHLHVQVKSWCYGESASDSCIYYLKGKKNIGRTSIVLHAALCDGIDRERNSKVQFYLSNGICGENKDEAYKEWLSDLSHWLKSLSKNKRYVVLLASSQIKVSDLQELYQKSKKLGKHICFVVKNIDNEYGEGLSLGNVDIEEFNISELTPMECYYFLEQYAEKIGNEKRFAEIKEKYKAFGDKEEYGKWFKLCSEGKPEKLIRFFELNMGSSEKTLKAFFEAIQNKVDKLNPEELAFLWGLCVEWKFAEQIKSGDDVKIEELVDVFKGVDLKSNPCSLAKVVLCGGRDSFPRVISCHNLGEIFRKSTVQVPYEFFVASIGVTNDEKNGNEISFNAMIADWVRFIVAKEDPDAKKGYADIIANAMVDSLFYSGFMGQSSTGEQVKYYLNSIDTLEESVGSSEKGCSFIATLREMFCAKVLDACIEGMGMAEDENIIDDIVVILRTWENRNDILKFVEYLEVTLPMFAIMDFNPKIVEVFSGLENLVKAVPNDSESDNIDSRLMPLAVGLWFLCGLRDEHRIASFEEVVRQCAKRIGGGTEIFEVMHESIFYLDENNFDGFYATSYKLFKLLEGRKEWNSVKVVLALELVELHQALCIDNTNNLELCDNDNGEYQEELCDETEEASEDLEDNAEMNEAWHWLLNEIRACKFAYDVDDRLLKTVCLKIMLRISYFKYSENDSCNPWLINTDSENDKIQLFITNIGDEVSESGVQDYCVSSLSPNDILRFMPEIVTHYSNCVLSANNRGLRTDEEKLKNGWLQIYKVATTENWFESINTRSKCQALYCSSKIVRDVMDLDEQNAFCNRVRRLCDDVIESKSKWYHCLVLRTLRNIIKDKHLLSADGMAEFVYDFVFQKYPAVLRNDSSNLDYWYDCAMEWFTDCLGDVTYKYEPFDVFGSIVEVFCDEVDFKDCQGGSSVVKDGCENDEKSPEEIYEKFTMHIDGKYGDKLVSAFEDFLDDFWNKSSDIMAMPLTVKFVEVCCDSNVISILENYFSKIEESDEGWGECRKFGIIGRVLRLKVNCLNRDLNHDDLSLVSNLMDRCDSSEDYIDINFYNSLKLECVLQNGPLSKKYQEFCQKWNIEIVKIVKSYLDDDSEKDVWNEKKFLRAIWDKPNSIYESIGNAYQKKMFDRLEVIWSKYASGWVEDMCRDWFYVVGKMIVYGNLLNSSESMLSRLEEMFFSGEFENSCPFYSVIEILEKLVVVRNHRLLDDFLKMCELAGKYRKDIELLSYQDVSNNVIDGNNIVQPSDTITKIKSIVDCWPSGNQNSQAWTMDPQKWMHDIKDESMKYRRDNELRK